MDPDTFRTSKTEEFLRMNPNGKVPVLVDGDLVMWEGCAICNYLLGEVSKRIFSGHLREKKFLNNLKPFLT